jgi:5-methylcytosine-specific restriction protein A
VTRSVPEWIGKTDDTAIPRRVKARVFLAHGGICHISGRKITPADQWDCDHVKALCNGGENRESNLAPALRDKHREKTAQDVDEKSKTERIRAKHLGIWPEPARKLRSRGFESGRGRRVTNIQSEADQ